jgi:hypothetical protein
MLASSSTKKIRTPPRSVDLAASKVDAPAPTASAPLAAAPSPGRPRAPAGIAAKANYRPVNANRTVTVMATGTGVPFSNVGVNDHRLTASIAA